MQKIHFSSAYIDDKDLEALYKNIGNASSPGIRTKAESDKLIAAYNKLQEDEFKHCISEMEEGAVLLKNTNNALPLGASELKASLFGHATVQPLYRPQSGGPVTDNYTTTTTAINPKSHRADLYRYEDALKDVGFQINETLFDAYNAGFLNRTYSRTGKLGMGAGQFGAPFNLGERQGLLPDCRR